MSLSPKETRILLKSLHEQGAEIRTTSKGHLVLVPGGNAVAVHWTNSDHRAARNLRAELRRAGFHWPFDKQQPNKRTTPAESTEQEPIMTKQISLTEGTAKQIYHAAAEQHAPFSPLQLSEATGLSRSTISRAIEQLALTRVSRGLYRINWDSDDATLRTVMEERTAPEEQTVTEQTVAEETETSWHPPVEETILPPTPQVIDPRGITEPHTQLFDPRNSWVIPNPHELNQLAHDAAKLGLSMEVRVWRTDQ